MLDQKPYTMHTLLNCIRGMYKVLESDWIKIAQEIGLTTAELHAIWVLDQEGPTTMTKIAQIGLWDISTVMAIIKRLKKKELVTVSKSEEDRRISFVSLTDNGKALKLKSVNMPKLEIENYVDQLWESGEEGKEQVLSILNFSKGLNEHFHNEEFNKWVNKYENKSRPINIE